MMKTIGCGCCGEAVQVHEDHEGPALCSECDEVYIAWASGPTASDHAPVGEWLELVSQGKTPRSLGGLCRFSF